MLVRHLILKIILSIFNPRFVLSQFYSITQTEGELDICNMYVRVREMIISECTKRQKFYSCATEEQLLEMPASFSKESTLEILSDHKSSALNNFLEILCWTFILSWSGAKISPLLGRPRSILIVHLDHFILDDSRKSRTWALLTTWSQKQIMQMTL